MGGHSELGGATSLSPRVCAEVLFSASALCPVAVGEFLSHDNEFAKACSELYFAELHLTGLSIDEALRHMSMRLCLPRESQQVDRMLEALSAAYHDSNPRVFADKDAAHLTAYAVALLNSDAHSAAVKKKMTKEEFVRNVPGVDSAQLDAIYSRVTKEELVLDTLVALGTRPPGKDAKLISVLNELVRDEATSLVSGLCATH